MLKGRPLSDHEHNDDLDHDYDHEAFLGDEAAEFDELSPEESQRRLGEIVDRIDVSSDGQVSVEELQQWIHFTQTRYNRTSCLLRLLFRFRLDIYVICILF